MKSNSEKAMTLLEVVVATAIFSLIVFGAISIIDSQTMQNKAIESRLNVAALRQNVLLNLNCRATVQRLPNKCAVGRSVALYQGASGSRAFIPLKDGELEGFAVRARCTGRDREFNVQYRSKKSTWVDLFSLPITCPKGN